MKPRCVEVRELAPFTLVSIADEFSISIDAAARLVHSLLVHGILTNRRPSEFDVFNSSFENLDTGTYVFDYVGLVLYEDLVISVYPKYFTERRPTQDELGMIFRAIRKSSKEKEQVGPIDEDDGFRKDTLALMLALIDSYGEYGLYSNYLKVVADNGPGSISWERTVSTSQPVISDGAPVYFDYKTIETSRDTTDFVTRLHQCVLTECSRFLQDIGINELLALDQIELSSEDMDDFGDPDTIAYRLEQERSVQYVTWKQELIDLLHAFVVDGAMLMASDGVACFGTSSFYHVWEESCKVALNDKIDTSIDCLGIPLQGIWKTRRAETLLEIIPRPHWTTCEKDIEYCGPVDTLKPDVVTLSHTRKNNLTFCIYDAKYYTPTLGKKVIGTPGVESIAKQYLYQSAYELFIIDHQVATVINAFLVPTSANEYKRLGEVEFLGVFARREQPFANHIDMWALPAKMIFECYLHGRSIGENVLDELAQRPYGERQLLNA